MYDSWKKWFVKWMAVVLTVVMGMGLCAGFPVGAAYENTQTNTGNQRADIVAIAQTQVGYREGSLDGTISGSNNYTKYNVDLYKIDGSYCYAWCQSFIAWCAKQAGVSSSVIKRTAGTIDAMDFFKSQQVWQGNSYTPQSGDIIYFRSSSSNSGYHVGIVESVSGSTIHTIEGNYSNKVARHSVSVGASSIVGYGVPNYEGLPSTVLSVTTGNSSTETTFSWNAINGATGYDVKIWKGTLWEGDPYLIEWGASNPFSVNLPEGTYQAYVDTRFGSDISMSNAVEFTIKAGCKVDVEVGNSSTETVFSWNAVNGATGYDVKIWKGTLWEGDPYLIEWGASNPFSVNLPEGTYQAYVDTRFGSDISMSNAVEFTIEKYNNLLGDLNTDGTLTSSDTILLQDYLLGRSVLTNDQKQQADLNQDGVIDGFDLALLKHLLLASE